MPSWLALNSLAPFWEHLLFLTKNLNIVHFSQFSKAALSIVLEIILRSSVISIKFSMSKVSVEWKYHNHVVEECINLIQWFFDYQTPWCVFLCALTHACTGFWYAGDVSEQGLHQGKHQCSSVLASEFRVVEMEAWKTGKGSTITRILRKNEIHEIEADRIEEK